MMKDYDYFFAASSNIFYELKNIIELDKGKWCIIFDHSSGWKYKALDSISKSYTYLFFALYSSKLNI